MLCCKTLILFKTSQTLLHRTLAFVLLCLFGLSRQPTHLGSDHKCCLAFCFRGPFVRSVGQNLCSTGTLPPVSALTFTTLGQAQGLHGFTQRIIQLTHPTSHSSPLFLSSGQKIRFLSEFMITTRLPSDQSWDMKGRKNEKFTPE